MEIAPAELEARIRAARDQEQILIWLLGGQSALLIGPDEIPKRLEDLGDTYQHIVLAFNALAGLLGCPIATERSDIPIHEQSGG